MFALLMLFMSAGVDAAPKAELFEAASWERLSHDPGHPAIVVLSTTDCVHCPGVIRSLAREKSRYPGNPRLIAVVMDGGLDIVGKSPYNLAERVFVFGKNPQALRYSVNPDWRGVTPYIALLSPYRPIQYLVGPPAERDIRAFFARP